MIVTIEKTMLTPMRLLIWYKLLALSGIKVSSELLAVVQLVKFILTSMLLQIMANVMVNPYINGIQL